MKNNNTELQCERQEQEFDFWQKPVEEEEQLESESLPVWARFMIVIATIALLILAHRLGFVLHHAGSFHA
ncbi:hypothetical protein KGP84_22765 [Burkholderia multivorans]|uniref:hypothetical protein n=1 Tax=Burkholderia multivorans TaxID=87883 RepID=UPI0020A22D4C|nr:hypothetical protein [Burkholderia multivorans]MCO8552972.1 hypothetical protein [Burkholderia multivorans]